MSSISVRTTLYVLALTLGVAARASADDTARNTPDATSVGSDDTAPDDAASDVPAGDDAPGQQEPGAIVSSGSESPAAPVAAAGSRSHRHQFGFRVGAGADGRFAIRYKDGPSCGDGAETFCRRLGTGLLDAELGFGVSDTVEVTLLGRFGLADDAAARALPVMIGLGVRAYSDPEAVAKVFFGGRAMLDLTSSDVPGYGSFDIGLRGEFGVMVDVLHQLGIFAQLGAAIHVLQALNFIGDVTAGVQARFP